MISPNYTESYNYMHSAARALYDMTILSITQSMNCDDRIIIHFCTQEEPIKHLLHYLWFHGYGYSVSAVCWSVLFNNNNCFIY